MWPEKSSTPYFDDAFYTIPAVRLKYEPPANDAAIRAAYRLVSTKQSETFTSRDRLIICKAVRALDRTVLKVSRKLEPEWVAILLTHKALNSDLHFPWWYVVEPYTRKLKPPGVVVSNTPTASGANIDTTVDSVQEPVRYAGSSFP